MSEKSTDEVAIRTAAMDYAEGWFEGDVERMERALHPKLAKRAVERRAGSRERVFVDLTKDDMLRFTRAGGGTGVPRDKLYYKVDILDICEAVADVRVETVTYIDYLHLLNEGGKWLILNVIYTLNLAKG